MRAPAPTAKSIALEAHYAEVKKLVGNLTILNGLEKEDFKIYQQFTGSPEAVAARIMEARAARRSDPAPATGETR